MPGIYFVIELWVDMCHNTSWFATASKKERGRIEYQEHIVTIKRGGVYIPTLENCKPIEFNAVGNVMCKIECGWMRYLLLTWIGGLNFII